MGSMQLSGPQMQALCEEMARGFTVNELTRFLRFQLQLELEDVAGPGTKPQRIFFAVSDAQRHDWLEALLDKLASDGPNDALKALAGRLLAAAPAAAGAGGGADPIHDLVVSRRAFVDRSNFRNQMREFRDGNARVAVVKGLKGGGNSHSWFFIEHLARETPPTKARLVDLKKWRSDEGPSPDDVMANIASLLGLSRDGWPADDLAQGARRSEKLVEWMVGKSQGLTEQYWIVIDHLDRIGLREDTVELAEQLAVEVETGNCQNLSLVLIGFDRTLRRDLDPYLLRDAPAGFIAPQVRQYFTDLAAAAGHAIAAAKLDELVDQTFDGLAAPAVVNPDELPFTKEEMQDIGGRLAHLSVRVIRGEELQ